MERFEGPTDIYEAVQAAAAKRYQEKQAKKANLTTENNSANSKDQQQEITKDAITVSERGSKRIRGFLSEDEMFFADPKQSTRRFNGH